MNRNLLVLQSQEQHDRINYRATSGVRGAVLLLSPSDARSFSLKDRLVGPRRTNERGFAADAVCFDAEGI